MLLCVLDFQDDPTTSRDAVQVALDAANSGDRLYFPGVKVYAAPLGGWRIRSGIEIFGDGPGDVIGLKGTIFTSAATPGAGSKHVFVIEPQPNSQLPHLYIHDLSITQSTIPGADLADVGIDCNAPGPTNKLSEVRLERLVISGMRIGIRLVGANGGLGAVVGVSLLDCTIVGCREIGVRLVNTYSCLVLHCEFSFNGAEGCFTTASGLALYGCTFQANRQSAAGLADLAIEATGLARVDACSFLDSSVGLRLDGCSGGYVRGCLFTGLAPPLSGAKDIVLTAAVLGSVAGAIVIMPNVFTRTSKPIVVEPTFSIVGLTVLPQLSDTAADPLELPSEPNNVPLGVPSRNSAMGMAWAAGLLLPAPQNNPDSGAQPGALAYVASAGKPRVYSGGAWRDILLDGTPPPPINDLALTASGSTIFCDIV